MDDEHEEYYRYIQEVLRDWEDHEIVKPTEEQLIALEMGEFELHGRTRISEDEVLDKHIGWYSYFSTYEEANKWIKKKTGKIAV